MTKKHQKHQRRASDHVDVDVNLLVGQAFNKLVQQVERQLTVEDHRDASS